MNAKMGRPPKDPDELRCQTIRLPLTFDEKALIESVAHAAGEKATTWAREVVLRAARKKRGTQC